MIGRDRIVIRWKNGDGDPVEKILRGIVVTDREDGKWLDSFFGGSRLSGNYYRLVIPRTLRLDGAQNITVSFRDRTNVKLETPITPIYDGRGRVRHFEAVVRSN